MEDLHKSYNLLELWAIQQILPLNNNNKSASDVTFGHGGDHVDIALITSNNQKISSKNSENRTFVGGRQAEKSHPKSRWHAYSTIRQEQVEMKTDAICTKKIAGLGLQRQISSPTPSRHLSGDQPTQVFGRAGRHASGEQVPFFGGSFFSFVVLISRISFLS